MGIFLILSIFSDFMIFILAMHQVRRQTHPLRPGMREHRSDIPSPKREHVRASDSCYALEYTPQ